MKNSRPSIFHRARWCRLGTVQLKRIHGATLCLDKENLGDVRPPWWFLFLHTQNTSSCFPLRTTMTVTWVEVVVSLGHRSCSPITELFVASWNLKHLKQRWWADSLVCTTESELSGAWIHNLKKCRFSAIIIMKWPFLIYLGGHFLAKVVHIAFICVLTFSGPLCIKSLTMHG